MLWSRGLDRLDSGATITVGFVKEISVNRSKFEHAGLLTEEALAFGSFRLIPARRMLLEADKPLRLGSRALDILIALVERAGELVSKDELLARVWPSTFVEEANLRVHVGALRKVLGDGRSGHRYISNVSGRGYCFVADVTRLQQRQSPNAAAPEPRHTDNLPAPLTRMIGRLDTISILAGQLRQRRFVTIVGPGGIGKTTVALAIAENLVDSHEHRACFLDVASLTDPLLLAASLDGFELSDANAAVVADICRRLDGIAARN